MSDFIDFIRKQGVAGLAVGFILGGAVSKVVSALVSDIVNPIIGIFLGKTGSLASASFSIGAVTILWGHFISVVIDFIGCGTGEQALFFAKKGAIVTGVDVNPKMIGKALEKKKKESLDAYFQGEMRPICRF